MDEERHVVEQYLLDGKLDVVFATSTLEQRNFHWEPLCCKLETLDKDSANLYSDRSCRLHNMAGRLPHGFALNTARCFCRRLKERCKVGRRYLNLDRSLARTE